MKKILWAVDAFESTTAIRDRVARVLATLARTAGAKVTPVHLLNPRELGHDGTLTEAELERYRPAARKALDSKLEGVRFEGLEPGQVAAFREDSRKGSIRALLGQARAMGADLIAVGTHGREGVERLFIGSFAEALMMHSDLPVLVVGTECGSPRPLAHLLFATDFSEASRRAFGEAIGLARSLEARITLLHAMPKPIDPVLASGAFLLAGSWVPGQEYYQAQKRGREEIAREWAQRGIMEGVRTDWVVDSSPGPVAERILRQARERESGMIALAAQSGPVAAAFLGSVAREVVRAADCPVWLLRSEAAAK